MVVVDGSNKRAKKSVMPPNVGTWDEEVTHTQFCKVLIASALGLLPIPNTFESYLDSVPDTVTLNLMTGYQSDITISDVSGKACFDQDWAPFAVAHDPKIGYLLNFKKIYPKVYKVVIYNYNQAEVVKRWPKHPEAFRRIVEQR